MKLFFILCLLVKWTWINCNLPSYNCQPYMQETQPQTATVKQGYPGKIGPAGPEGPAGPPGLPGVPGRCSCDSSEIEQMRLEIQNVNEQLRKKKQLVNDTIQSETQRIVEQFKADLQRTNENYAALRQTLRENNDALCTVGIKDRRIPNSAMTASSVWRPGYEPYYSRLDSTGEPRGYWYPSSSNSRQWIQVDVGSPTRVVGVITQGRHVGYTNWVTSFKMLYGNSTSNLAVIQNQETNADMVFQGNRDRTTKVTNFFPQPITARYFRLQPVTWHGYIVVRLEYLTC